MFVRYVAASARAHGCASVIAAGKKALPCPGGGIFRDARYVAECHEAARSSRICTGPHGLARLGTNADIVATCGNSAIARRARARMSGGMVPSFAVLISPDTAWCAVTFRRSSGESMRMSALNFASLESTTQLPSARRALAVVHPDSVAEIKPASIASKALLLSVVKGTRKHAYVHAEETKDLYNVRAACTAMPVTSNRRSRSDASAAAAARVRARSFVSVGPLASKGTPRYSISVSASSGAPQC